MRLFYHWNPLGRRLFRMFHETYLAHFGDVRDQPRTMAQYDAWAAGVRRAVPAPRLLVYNVSEVGDDAVVIHTMCTIAKNSRSHLQHHIQGWSPLCRFLDVPPARCPPEHEPFPRVLDNWFEVRIARLEFSLCDHC